MAAEPERQHQLSLNPEDKDVLIIAYETFLKHKVPDEDGEEVDKMFTSNSGIPLLRVCPA